MQPGDTITPGGSNNGPTPPDNNLPPATPGAVPQHVTVPAWNYESTDQNHDASNESADGGVTWTASEYVDHPKGASWFMVFGFVVALIVLVTYIATRDILAPVLLAVAGITFGVFAARQPQVLTYHVDDRGITIGRKQYFYGEFKSFSIIEEGPLRSMLFTPLKRFAPPLTVYYDPRDEEAIMAVVGDYLPVEHGSHDFVEQLMRRLRF